MNGICLVYQLIVKLDYLSVSKTKKLPSFYVNPFLIPGLKIWQCKALYLSCRKQKKPNEEFIDRVE
ncbi:MAG TPA: hypothetical protein PLC48_15020, partial [Ferruginibacter sp.]|nr:hypothetical protein [Ferruginibacter sp.]